MSAADNTWTRHIRYCLTVVLQRVRVPRLLCFSDMFSICFRLLCTPNASTINAKDESCPFQPVGSWCHKASKTSHTPGTYCKFYVHFCMCLWRVRVPCRLTCRASVLSDGGLPGCTRVSCLRAYMYWHKPAPVYLHARVPATAECQLGRAWFRAGADVNTNCHEGFGAWT